MEGGGDFSVFGSFVVLMSTYTERAALAFLREKKEGAHFVEFQALVTAEECGDGYAHDVKVKVLEDDVRWCSSQCPCGGKDDHGAMVVMMT